MKLIILFLILISVSAYSQIKATTENGKQVILNSDNTWQYSNIEKQDVNIPDLGDELFYWKDGYDKIVPVKFTNRLPFGETVEKEPFEKMITTSLIKAKYRLKNNLSFVPRELLFIKRDEKYVIRVTYLGKNAYGAESKTYSIFDFNLKGELTTSY